VDGWRERWRGTERGLMGQIKDNRRGGREKMEGWRKGMGGGRQ
jgi:hypothetical protein